MGIAPESHIRLRSFAGLSAEHRRDAEILRGVGEKYRIFADECRDPYIPCDGGGQIYVYGPGKLGAYVKTRKPGKTLKAIRGHCPGVVATQTGDEELAVWVPVEEGGALARFMKARRRAVYSAEELERRREVGKRLAAASGFTGVENPDAAEKCVELDVDDP